MWICAHFLHNIAKIAMNKCEGRNLLIICKLIQIAEK